MTLRVYVGSAGSAATGGQVPLPTLASLYARKSLCTSAHFLGQSRQNSLDFLQQMSHQLFRECLTIHGRIYLHYPIFADRSF